MDQLLALRTKHYDVKFVGGGTGNYKVNPRMDDSAVFLNLSKISELCFFREDEDFFEFGAGLRVSEMQDIFDDFAQVDKLPAIKVFQEVLSSIASTQIRKVATVGGALMWPHTCSDLMILCSALKCTLITILPNDDCQLVEVKMNEAFFPHGMKDITHQKSIIKSIRVPKLDKSMYMFAFHMHQQ